MPKVAKLSVGKDTVTVAQTAAKSSVALEAFEGGQISLAEAAVLAEFEEDGQETVDRLVRAAGTPQFDHVVSQLRCERASAQALAQATAHYTERGFTILDEQQRWGWHPQRVPMRYLQRDGDDGEPEGVDESVITDPQHWPIWLDEYTEYGTVKSIGGLIVRVLCCASFGWKALSQFTFRRRSCSPGVISFQTVKRSAISWRHPVADSR